VFIVYVQSVLEAVAEVGKDPLRQMTVAPVEVEAALGI
jgi:hypothetical protein